MFIVNDLPIAPLIAIGFSVILGIMYMIMSKDDKQKAKSNSKQGGNGKTTAQQFLNVMDIENNILYGLDGYKRIFIELEGVCIDLLNNHDIQRLIKSLSSEISKANMEFDLFAISRPFNIELLKEEYEEEILNAKTDIQRTMLRNALSQILGFGENGEVVERKFYLIVQGLENESEIIKKADLLMECFKDSGLSCRRLQNAEIKRLINLFNNISTYNYDKMEDTTNAIPIINEELQKQKTIDEKVKEKLAKEQESNEKE